MRSIAGLESQLAAYLRAAQSAGRRLGTLPGQRLDLSCSVKAYYALKLAGDDPAGAHMERARSAILEQGGAARANVFTRMTLAMFGQIPWRGVPFLPVEIVLLPRWFPFHLAESLILVPDGHGTARDPVQSEGSSTKSARGRDPGVVRHSLLSRSETTSRSGPD